MSEPWSSEHRAAVINTAVTEAWHRHNPTFEAKDENEQLREQLDSARQWAMALERQIENTRRFLIERKYVRADLVLILLDAPLSSPAAAGRQTAAAGDPTGPCI